MAKKWREMGNRLDKRMRRGDTEIIERQRGMDCRQGKRRKKREKGMGVYGSGDIIGETSEIKGNQRYIDGGKRKNQY